MKYSSIIVMMKPRAVSPAFPQSLALEAPARIKNKAPPPDWPQEGEVVFDRTEMRYRDNLPLVLKNLSCTIQPKEKIGIVGRTGSGQWKQSVKHFSKPCAV